MKRIICCLLIVVFCVMCCVVSVSAVEVDENLTDSAYTPDMLRYGDVDLDGSVSGIDTVYTMRYIVGLHKSAHMFLADVDNDGFVTIMDVTQMQRYLVGIRAREYGDCTGVYSDSNKISVAKSVYWTVMSHFDGNFFYVPDGKRGPVSDESVAACLTYLDKGITRDADLGLTSYVSGDFDVGIWLNLIFHDWDAVLAGEKDVHMVDAMKDWTADKRGLYYCLRAFCDKMDKPVAEQDYRIANYYYHCIQDWFGDS